MRYKKNGESVSPSLKQAIGVSHKRRTKARQGGTSNRDRAKSHVGGANAFVTCKRTRNEKANYATSKGRTDTALAHKSHKAHGRASEGFPARHSERCHSGGEARTEEKKET